MGIILSDTMGVSDPTLFCEEVVRERKVVPNAGSVIHGTTAAERYLAASPPPTPAAGAPGVGWNTCNSEHLVLGGLSHAIKPEPSNPTDAGASPRQSPRCFEVGSFVSGPLIVITIAVYICVSRNQGTRK